MAEFGPTGEPEPGTYKIDDTNSNQFEFYNQLIDWYKGQGVTDPKLIRKNINRYAPRSGRYLQEGANATRPWAPPPGAFPEGSPLAAFPQGNFPSLPVDWFQILFPSGSGNGITTPPSGGNPGTPSFPPSRTRTSDAHQRVQALLARLKTERAARRAALQARLAAKRRERDARLAEIRSRYGSPWSRGRNPTPDRPPEDPNAA